MILKVLRKLQETRQCGKSCNEQYSSNFEMGLQYEKLQFILASKLYIISKTVYNTIQSAKACEVEALMKILLKALAYKKLMCNPPYCTVLAEQT